MAFIAVFILFFYSTTLALIVIFAVLLNLSISFALFPSMRRRMEEEILAGAKEQTHLMETVRAATTLKLMGRESEREGAWRNLHAETTNASHLGRHASRSSQSFAQTLITGLQTVAVIYVGARLVIDGAGFSVGMLFAFMSFRQTFTDRAIGLVNQIIQFRFLRLYLDRLADIVTTPAETQRGSARRGRGEVAGHIRLKDVSFRYGVTDPLVLEDINLEIEPGDFIAMTGASGSGKTTLLKLMLGLNRPTEGVDRARRLSGQSRTLAGVASNSSAWWRRMIGCFRARSPTTSPASIPTWTWRACSRPPSRRRCTRTSCVRRCST